MDLISLYYFQELSKDLNMTRTAQRLYISQQTLSNHIHRLEQHYGCPLLYRKPTLSLTCAGEFVLSFAQVVRKEERNLEDILSDIEQQERGTLKLGAGSQRGAWILSHLLPDFHRRYPLVQVRFSDGLSTHLETLVSSSCTRSRSISVSRRACCASTIPRTRSGASSCAPSRGPRSGTLPGCPSP